MTQEEATKVLEAFQAFHDTLQRWAARVAGRLIAARHRILARWWEDYAAAGCPYGVSSKGLWRWVREQGVPRQDRKGAG